ncbi:MAG: fatty acid desaturase [Acidobacteria bacterium]|nr:fatty acid desaturase [Acidobacteriota bacterium]
MQRNWPRTGRCTVTHQPESTPGKPAVSVSEWKRIVARYEKPSAGRATWQLVNTFGPYFLLWVLMYWTMAFSFWPTLPLAALAGALLVRVFIICHDCGHGSFFQSPLANAVTGFFAGMLTFTPFYHWRWQHSLHHATSGDLDRRGMSDIWTMTVQEYLESSRWKRFAYRLARNPFVLFVIAPLFVFLIRHRFSSPKAGPRERHSVWWMNGAVLGMAGALSWWFGIMPYLLLQLIVMMVAGAAGVWLFYVQHQFEDAYWERSEDWNFTAAALQGSSFYKLPRILQWFSGNIGYHHVHHLSSRIPNYNLERCHKSHPLFQGLKPITLVSSLNSLTIHLWDEGLRKLVGFRHLRKLRREEQRGGREGCGGPR